MSDKQNITNKMTRETITEKDYIEAEELYKNAIDMGDTKAMVELAMLYFDYCFKRLKDRYYKTIGSPTFEECMTDFISFLQDYKKGFDMLMKAINLNDSDAIVKLVDYNGLLYEHVFDCGLIRKNISMVDRVKTINDFNFIEVEIAVEGYVRPIENKENELLERAVEMNNCDAMRRLARSFSTSKERMIELYERAVGMGDTIAMMELARKYIESKELGTDYQKGIELYEKAVNLGDIHAMIQLAELHNGHGIYRTCEDFNKRDHKKAFDLLEKAVSLGELCGLKYLALMYSSGIDTPDFKLEKNIEKADELLNQYEKLSEERDYFCIYHLML